MKKTEYYLVRIIIILAALGFGFYGAKTIGNAYYKKWVNTYNDFSLSNQYRTEINLETDPYKLAEMGMSFLRTENNELALTCFKRATVLDPNWRDGWIWMGYSELKLNQPEEALKSLKRAEEIDPIYPLTYQLLTIAYQQTGDTESAKLTQEKLVYLSKTYFK
jgi:tetratricopeptide (TPR) repeat protein